MDILELKDVCRRVRRNIITMTNKAGAGHPGGSLSATEAMVALYFDVMKGVDPKDDKNPTRDRFVLSKGHAAPGLYGTLCERFPKGAAMLNVILPMTAFLLCVAYIVNSGYNPFLYFRF